MTFKIEQLKAVMDNVRDNPDLKAIRDNDDSIKETYCNLNAYKVVQALGLNLFWNFTANEGKGRVMMANEMFEEMFKRPEAFSRFQSHMAAFELVNKGYLIFAAQKEESHGHIAPIYPSVGMVTSGKWLVQVPYCSNVGARNDIIGLNYAFADPPDYFIVL